MQEPTHILAGVIIQRALFRKWSRAAMFIPMAIIAFLSHGILDKLSNVTFHPHRADFHSVIWDSYHFGVLMFTILFLYLWWRSFKWGILFAMLPDLDWVFIHGQEALHLRLSWYQQPHLHHFLGWVLARIPGLAWLDHLPNNREHPWAAVWELLLVACMLTLIQFMTLKDKPETTPRTP
jgi:hypothetical protein